MKKLSAIAAPVFAFTAQTAMAQDRAADAFKAGVARLRNSGLLVLSRE